MNNRQRSRLYGIPDPRFHSLRLVAEYYRPRGRRPGRVYWRRYRLWSLAVYVYEFGNSSPVQFLGIGFRRNQSRSERRF